MVVRDRAPRRAAAAPRSHRHRLEPLRARRSVTASARSPHTGSVSTRRPSISSSTVEWPSHVARSPLCGARVQVSSGSNEGSGACGIRRSPPQRKSPIDGIGDTGSPRGAGCVFRKRSPSQRGEAAMRSSAHSLSIGPGRVSFRQISPRRPKTISIKRGVRASDPARRIDPRQPSSRSHVCPMRSFPKEWCASSWVSSNPAPR